MMPQNYYYFLNSNYDGVSKFCDFVCFCPKKAKDSRECFILTVIHAMC